MYRAAVTLSDENSSILPLLLVEKRQSIYSQITGLWPQCHRDRLVQKKWLQRINHGKYKVYNQQHRPKAGQTENFSNGDAHRTFHRLVFSTWLCKSIQKLQKEKKRYQYMCSTCLGPSISRTYIFYTILYYGILLLLLYLNLHDLLSPDSKY